MAGATRWIQEALTAWINADFTKVSTVAPLAVELLGKAALWNANPALLVPLAANAEASLIILTQRPDLAAPKLRTVGLQQTLGRLEALLGGLPLDGGQRTRMVETRNGAMHVGSADQSRFVLTDCLIVCAPLLENIDQSAASFYGDHLELAERLVQQGRSDVEHRVDAKRAKADAVLRRLQSDVGDMFDEVASKREDNAEFELDPEDFGATTTLYPYRQECPVCGKKGRLFGDVDVSPEIDYDVEPNGTGEYEGYHVPYFSVLFYPQVFACNVCRLVLNGQPELAACSVSSSILAVQSNELGDDFDPGAVAEQLYGSRG